MDRVSKRKWPRSGLKTTVMGFGTAPIGNIFRSISEEDSTALIKAANAGVRYFDSAPMYGHGPSEARCGQGLRWHPRDQYVLSTKVGAF